METNQQPVEPTVTKNPPIQNLQKQHGTPTTPTPTPQQEKQTPAQFIWEVLKVVIISLAIVIPVRFFLFQPFYVKQVSMLPNLQQYDYLVVSILSYRLHNPERGDVVVFHTQDQEPALIKRVIGLPGETVEVKDTHVYINGTELDESAYLADTVETWGDQKVQLGDDDYFVLGDNRTQSKDSRFFGPISKEIMVGKSWLRLWPFSRLNHFEELDYTIGQK